MKCGVCDKDITAMNTFTGKKYCSKKCEDKAKKKDFDFMDIFNTYK